MSDSGMGKLKEQLILLGKGLIPTEICAGDLCYDELMALTKYLQDASDFLQGIAAGDLDVAFDYKGTLAGSMKTLQASLRHLSWQTSEVANGDFNQRIDFMGDFADSFNQMVANLKELFIKFEEKNEELIKFQSVFDKDIRLAEDAQVKMMQFWPQTDFSKGEKYYAALQRVSGDFYHEFFDKQGNLNFFVGDATGHGVAAGLVTMMARTAIESVSPSLPTNVLLGQVNDLLCNCLPDDMYISGLFGRLFPNGKLIISSAGHFPTVIIRNYDAALILTEGGGMPLGMFSSDIAFFEEESYQLEKGDRFYCFTDGIVECRNNQEQFGLKRLHSLFQKLQAEDIETALSEIIGQLWDFCAETGFEDDVLILAHEYTGCP